MSRIEYLIPTDNIPVFVLPYHLMNMSLAPPMYGLRVYSFYIIFNFVSQIISIQQPIIIITIINLFWKRYKL